MSSRGVVEWQHGS